MMSDTIVKTDCDTTVTCSSPCHEEAGSPRPSEETEMETSVPPLLSTNHCHQSPDCLDSEQLSHPPESATEEDLIIDVDTVDHIGPEHCLHSAPTSPVESLCVNVPEVPMELSHPVMKKEADCPGDGGIPVPAYRVPSPEVPVARAPVIEHAEEGDDNPTLPLRLTNFSIVRFSSPSSDQRTKTLSHGARFRQLVTVILNTEAQVGETQLTAVPQFLDESLSVRLTVLGLRPGEGRGLVLR